MMKLIVCENQDALGKQSAAHAAKLVNDLDNVP